ncbi:MAG: YgiQ family radical SAM protein [Polyangiaceae bacterium]
MDLVPAHRLSKKGPRSHDGGRRASFLPTTREEMEARGWSQLDILIVTGDAYVDHPAFGPVLIARFLEGRGFKVGIVAQPKWNDPSDIGRMGRPRLFVGVSAGNLDSMLNKLTAQKKVRGEDQYSPGGRNDMRPNRASIVYANLCRQAFPGLPVVLGGIEASLRRIAHYDYWSDSVRRSILLDAKADLLVFGMGERPVWEIARRLDAGEPVSSITDVRGTARVLKNKAAWEPLLADTSRFVADRKLLVLPSYDEVVADKAAFARMSKAFQFETNAHNGRPLLQVHGSPRIQSRPHPDEEADGRSLRSRSSDVRTSGYDERIVAFETVKTHRHDARMFRRPPSQHHRTRRTHHPEPFIEASVLREVGTSRGASTASSPTSGAHREHVQDRADDVTESACRRPLVRASRYLREPRDRPRAHRLARSQGARRDPGVKRVFVASGVRYDLAERSPEVHQGARSSSTRRSGSVAPEHSAPDGSRR